MRDDRVRAALERMAPPTESPDFFARLWLRVEAAERRTVRRWRMLAVVAAVAAIAGTAAASVLAIGRSSGAVVDRTLTCPAPRGGLDLFAHEKTPSLYVYEAAAPGNRRLIPHPALVELDAARSVLVNAGVTQVVQTTYAGAYAGTALTQKSGYTLDGSVCRAAPPIDFGSSGLNPARGGVYRECTAGSPVTFRARIVLSRAGLPVAAKLMLRGGGKRARSIAYIDWTPTRVRAWLAQGCRQYTELAP